MTQVIHDFMSGDEVDSLEFTWDANWKPQEGKDPWQVLFDFTKGQRNWDSACDAIADLMLVNGQKISGATLGARMNGEWIYLTQIVDGVLTNALRQAGKI